MKMKRRCFSQQFGFQWQAKKLVWRSQRRQMKRFSHRTFGSTKRSKGTEIVYWMPKASSTEMKKAQSMRTSSIATVVSPELVCRVATQIIPE